MGTLGRLTGTGTAVVALALGVAAGVAGAAQQHGWQKALSARSDALNRHYGLGQYARTTLGRPAADWRRALELRSEALNRKYGLGKVTVRISFVNDGRDVSDGSLAGKGRFTATGAIADKGSVLIYRTTKPGRITLRYVTVGAKGTITYVVSIDIARETARWRITSATKAYEGLRGQGTERENPPNYTVSILSGTVSR